MSKQRVEFQLLLLQDGRALAIGAGYNACEGECSGFPPESTSARYADLFDPATNSWKTASGLNLNRSDYAAVLLPDGRVVVAGGYADAPDECFSSTKLFDPVAGTWTQATGLMNLARCDPAYALLPDGRVLLAGGTDIHNKVLASAEVFDPTSQKWSAVASMPAVRAGGEAVALKSGKVLVVGGYGSSGATLNSALLYDPASGKWSSAGTLSASPNGPIVLLPDGGTLVIGEGSLDNITDKWTAQASERFDPSALTWTKVGAMAKSRRSPFVASLADGRVLVAGGAVAQSFNSSGLVTTLTSSAEIFDPATNSWSSTVAMPSVREAGDAVL
jgi:N-acetylneuraminic acid mutarotase